MTHYLYPRGDTAWQKFLRTLWWKIPLIAGLIVVIWRGTDREKLDYLYAMIAIGVLLAGWDMWHTRRRSR